MCPPFNSHVKVRVRERQRFGEDCQLRAISSVAFVLLRFFAPFLSRNCAKWHVGSDATKRSSKNGVCRMDSELQSGSARRARYVRSSAGKRDVAVASRRYEAHDEYINEWAQIAAWPQQGGGSSRDAL